MAVKIIKKEEHLKITLEGSDFFYRRIPSPERAEILQRLTPRRGGDPNWEKVMKEMLQFGLKDWSNVEDAEGASVPFDKELAGWLPQTIQVDLLDALGANVEQLQEEIKNLPAS